MCAVTETGLSVKPRRVQAWRRKLNCFAAAALTFCISEPSHAQSTQDSHSQPAATTQGSPARTTSPKAAAIDKDGVQIHLLIIETNKSLSSFDARIRGPVRRHLEAVGQKGGRVLDELTASPEVVGSRVEIEVLAAPKAPKKHLRVTLLGTGPEEVRLRVEIPELKFDTSTKQKPGTTVALALKGEQGQTLYLAVTPTK